MRHLPLRKDADRVAIPYFFDDCLERSQAVLILADADGQAAVPVHDHAFKGAVEESFFCGKPDRVQPFAQYAGDYRRDIEGVVGVDMVGNNDNAGWVRLTEREQLVQVLTARHLRPEQEVDQKSGQDSLGVLYLCDLVAFHQRFPLSEQADDHERVDTNMVPNLTNNQYFGQLRS